MKISLFAKIHCLENYNLLKYLENVIKIILFAVIKEKLWGNGHATKIAIAMKLLGYCMIYLATGNLYFFVFIINLDLE